MAFDWVTDPNDRKALEEYLRAKQADEQQGGIAAIGDAGRRASELITGVPNRSPGYKPQNVQDWLSQRQILSQNKTERRADDEAAWQGKVRERTAALWPKQDEATDLDLRTKRVGASEAEAGAAHNAVLRPLQEEGARVGLDSTKARVAHEQALYPTQEEAARVGLSTARTNLAGAQTEQAEKARQRKALADPTSLDSRVIVGLANKYQPGLVPEGTSGEAVLRVLPVLEKEYAATMARQPKPADTQKAAADRYLGQWYELDPSVPTGGLGDHWRENFINNAGEVADISGKAKELAKLIKGHKGEFTGEDAARIRTAVTDLMLRAKGTSVYQLGVLSGPDVQILTSIIEDPTKVGNFLSNTAGLRNVGAELDTFQRKVVDTFKAKAKSAKANPTNAEGNPFRDDPFAREREQLQAGEILIKRNGQVGAVSPAEFNPQTDERL